MKWGVLSQYSGTPRAVVRTKAYHAIIGYQIKGSSRIHWGGDYYNPGKYTFSMYNMKVARHRQVTLRLWVRYADASDVGTYGKTALTYWHTVKRP